MEKRNEFLDILKGVAIILVIIGHCIQYGSGSNYFSQEMYYSNGLFKFIYSFHLFFFRCYVTFERSDGMPQIITSLLQRPHLLRDHLCLVPLSIEMYLVAGYTSFHSGGDGCQVLHSGHIGLGEPDDLAIIIYEFSWRLAVFAFHLFAE